MEIINDPKFTDITWNPVVINYYSKSFSLLYAHDGDGGFDLYSTVHLMILPFGHATIPTGIFISLPTGYEGQVRPKSGLMSEGLMASFGTIDSGYRGEIKVVLFNFNFYPRFIKCGDKVAQLIITPLRGVTMNLLKHRLMSGLENTTRGEDGFGSTGGKYEG